MTDESKDVIVGSVSHEVHFEESWTWKPNDPNGIQFNESFNFESLSDEEKRKLKKKMLNADYSEQYFGKQDEDFVHG